MKSGRTKSGRIESYDVAIRVMSVWYPCDVRVISV